MEKDWISDILDIQLGCHFCSVNCPFACRVQIDLLLTTMTAKLPILALPKKQFDLYFFWILSKTLCWSLAFQFQLSRLTEYILGIVVVVECGALYRLIGCDIILSRNNPAIAFRIFGLSSYTNEVSKSWNVLFSALIPSHTLI